MSHFAKASSVAAVTDAAAAMMSPIYRIRGETNRAIEHELETWKRDHLDAMDAWRAEEVVQLLLQSRDGDKILFERTVQHLSGRSRSELSQRYEELRQVCNASIRALNKTALLVRELQKRGHKIEGTENIEQAVKDYSIWKEDLHDAILLCDSRMQQVLKKRLISQQEKKGRPTRRKAPTTK